MCSSKIGLSSRGSHANSTELGFEILEFGLEASTRRKTLLLPLQRKAEAAWTQLIGFDHFSFVWMAWKLRTEIKDASHIVTMWTSKVLSTWRMRV